jgi:hypothetical protein
VGADPAALLSAIGNSFAGPGAKVLISFPLIYHYLGGLRHFVSVFLYNTRFRSTMFLPPRVCPLKGPYALNDVHQTLCMIAA